jgi:hypothetical protein
MKFYIIVIAAIAAVSCKKLPVDKPDTIQDISYSNHPKHTVYQTALENYKKATASPGSILLIKKAGEELWIGSTGAANLEYQTPMRTNHQFRTGCSYSPVS